MAKSSRFSPEVRERAVRMVWEHQAQHASQWAAITSIAGKMGGAAETLRQWGWRGERDAGRRPGLTSEERGAADAARAGERRAAAGERDPPQSLGVVRPGGARPPSEMMVAFVDAPRGAYGVEPIWAVLVERLTRRGPRRSDLRR
jgi:transposase-like protein